MKKRGKWKAKTFRNRLFCLQKRGKKLGLALGGGSVRGLAHIGILKVFEKEKIPIHFLAGTSIGALIGACYASGLSAKRIEDIAFTTKWKELVDFTEPKTGFIAGKRIERYIRKIIGNKNFSELDIPLRVIATDLIKGEKVIFKEGDVTKAVRASISIPGVFSSVKMEKKELVDGGIIDPIPVDIVKNMGANIIIATDLSINLAETHTLSKKTKIPSAFLKFLKNEFYMKELEFLADYTKKFFIKFPKFILNMICKIIDWLLNPKRVYKLISGKTFPKVLKVMIESNTILTNQLSKEILNKKSVDVVIKPKIKGVKYAEFDKAKEIIKSGEKAALKQMPKIKKLVGIR